MKKYLIVLAAALVALAIGRAVRTDDIGTSYLRMGFK